MNETIAPSPGVTHLANRGMCPQALDQHHGVVLHRCQTNRQRAQTTQRQERLERARSRTLERAGLHQSLEDLIVGGDTQTDQQIAVATDELRTAVQHDCRTVLERPLQQRCRERRVDHHLRAGITRGDGDRRKVGNVERRVGRRLDPHDIGTDRAAAIRGSVRDVDGPQLDVTLQLVLGRAASARPGS